MVTNTATVARVAFVYCFICFSSNFSVLSYDDIKMNIYFSQ